MKLLSLALLSALISMPVLCAERAGVTPYPATMLIACTNASFQVPGTLFISVSITNGAERTVTISEPRSDPRAYEAALFDSAGNETDIGVRKTHINGPGDTFMGMNVAYQIRPHCSVECVVGLPLGWRLRPGDYRLLLRRWCAVLELGSGGSATSTTRQKLVSNELTIRIE